MRMKRNFVWKSWYHSSIAIARPVELGRRRFRQSVGGVQCAVCGLRARRFRHRTIFPPVFIRWAGPWCMRLGVDGNPRSWWHFNAWFRNGRTRGDPIRIFRLCFFPLWRLPHGPPQQRHRSTKTGGWTLRVWPTRSSLWYADVAGRQHARGYPWVAH